MPDTHYEILIIGAGQAGPGLAVALAKRGKHVALAERKDIGGSCVNFGCTPTKAAIASARVAHLARRAGEFGLRIPTVEVDFAAVLERAKSIVVKSRTGLQQWLEGTENLNLLKAHARFEGKDGDRFRVSVGGQRVTAAQVVLDTGTRSVIPPIEGLDKVDYIHAGNWLDTPELPDRLAVIGAGYIGLEMAQFYQRLGSRVIVIEGAGQVAGNEDPEIAAALQQLLENEGVGFRLNTQVTRIEGRTGKLRLILNGAGSAAVEATDVFVATGRRANTDDLGLETIGVATSKRGIVTADERLSTNVKGVWVAGDIRGGPMFTHTAWDDYPDPRIADRRRWLENAGPGDPLCGVHRSRAGSRRHDRARGARRRARGQNWPLRAASERQGGRGRRDRRVHQGGRRRAQPKAAGRRRAGERGRGTRSHLHRSHERARAPYPVIRDAV